MICADYSRFNFDNFEYDDCEPGDYEIFSAFFFRKDEEERDEFESN